MTGCVVGMERKDPLLNGNSVLRVQEGTPLLGREMVGGGGERRSLLHGLEFSQAHTHECIAKF